VKRLHKLLIGSFIKPLVATFFVAQFILILQFLWQHIDDLAGKGLEWHIIAELLLYASASLVPLALPLAVLLSSIMTFGNLGENFELSAIKSSGISLQKFMKPLTILVITLSIGAFFYSNHVIPYANLKALSLRYDIKKQREELQIREGIFYNAIEGYTIKVGHKNPKTKLMRDIMIYEHDQQIGNHQVTVADSGYIKMSSDETNLLVILYNGQTYEEMAEDQKKKVRWDNKKYPFQRRTFDKETLLIDISGFDFQRTDEGLFKDNYQMLKLSELESKKDSLLKSYNSKALGLSKDLHENIFVHENRTKRIEKNKKNVRKPKRIKGKQQAGQYNSFAMLDTAALKTEGINPKIFYDYVLPDQGPNRKNQHQPHFNSAFSESPKDNYIIRADTSDNQDQLNIPYHKYYGEKTDIEDNHNQKRFEGKSFKVDRFMDSLNRKDKMAIISSAADKARRNNQEITNSKIIFEQMQKNIYKHQIYWHKKLTLSFACIIFFFIGAPLGSIIRKGGLGAPLVISVMFFIIYYIISISGENFVEKGVLPAFVGMWLSSFVFLPMGIFLTYKATNDSVILDVDTYIKPIKKLLSLGLRKNGQSREKEPADFHEQSLG